MFKGWLDKFWGSSQPMWDLQADLDRVEREYWKIRSENNELRNRLREQPRIIVAKVASELSAMADEWSSCGCEPAYCQCRRTIEDIQMCADTVSDLADYIEEQVMKGVEDATKLS